MESVATSARPTFELRARERCLRLGDRTLIMGVVNATPDSFSDGGLYRAPEAALQRACLLLDEGADLIDVGGESSRPGALPISAAEEADRVIPVIERVTRQRPEALLSVDTCKADVAREALLAGAHIVNDISALGGDAAMAGVVAEARAGVVLMHMRGRPRTMQLAPPSDDICAEIRRDLGAAVRTARDAGIDPDRILLDPGIGFGKTLLRCPSCLRRNSGKSQVDCRKSEI